ncbi:MAG: hypothetical protein HYY67_03310 [Thaumarchaeota archaeon]|nr:hypothetical protein [Nitrososphaerota archaeon]
MYQESAKQKKVQEKGVEHADFQRELDGIISAHNQLILGIDQKAIGNKEGRAMQAL